MRDVVGYSLLLVFGAACSSRLEARPQWEPQLEVGVSEAQDDAEGGASVGADEGLGAPALVGSGLSGVPIQGSPVFTRFARLTHSQWEHSVRDLLRLQDLPGLSVNFAADTSESAFSNNERALIVTPTLSTDYQLAAETLAARVATDPESLARLDGTTGDAVADGGSFISQLGRRVYRRPLSPEEQARYAALFAMGPEVHASGNAFADGARLVIAAMLQSPHFLYRAELVADGSPLGNFEVASKLSFLLRDTTPDDALLRAAETGELGTSSGVVARARELLESPEAAAVVAKLHSELFGLDRYELIAKDIERFPQYAAALNPILREAEQLLLRDLFDGGGGLREILTSTAAYVNADTAWIYGRESSSESLESVDLGPQRPGMFTRAGFLAYNGTLRDPDAIHRGVELNHRVLCAQMEAPGGEIPSLPALEPGQTNRERITAHTGVGTCGARCHGAIINPIGFALERFDAMGQWRDTDNGKPVDTSGTYRFSDGLKSFADAGELMDLIAESPQAHACFARHLMEFSLGRELSAVTDQALSDRLENESVLQRRSTKQLILEVVGSPSFLNRPVSNALPPATGASR